MTTTTRPAAPVTARGRRTRDGLVSAARGVFEQRGWADTRMSDIAEAAGVSHGTVYVYFASKEDLLAEVCNAVVGEVFTALRVPAEQRADPVRHVEAGLRRYLDAWTRHARLLEVVEQAAATDERFRELVDGLRASYVERTAATVRRYQAEGRIPSDLDPEVVAPALVGMVEGFARRWHTGPGPDRGVDGGYDQEQVVATLTQLWTRATGLAGHRPAPDGGATP